MADTGGKVCCNKTYTARGLHKLMVSGDRTVNKPAARGDWRCVPTFAQIALPDQSPQHVGAVVAVRRPMESLLAEEMAVSAVAVERVAGAGVVAVRAHVDGGGGGGHFDREMRCATAERRAGRLRNADVGRHACGTVSRTGVQTGRRTSTIGSRRRHDASADATPSGHRH